MRSSVRFSIIFALLCGAWTTATAQNDRPQFRPAVLRFGADSLINQIDVDALLKKGQKDGAVMFSAIVSKTGAAEMSWTYKGTPGTDALDEELSKRLDTAKFTPPLYNHQPVGVLLQGTALFSANERPHLRIVLNQDPKEIKTAADFIAPQPVIGADSKLKGLSVNDGRSAVVLTGIALLEVNVDAKGNLQKLELVNEEPPLLGYGAAALEDLEGAKFIPAFRSGAPTDCVTVLPIAYKPTPTD